MAFPPSSTGRASFFLLFLFFVSASFVLSKKVAPTGADRLVHENPVQRLINTTTADSLPKTIDVTYVIPFEYKQSSLNFKSTFRLMDSVVDLIYEDDSITFTIDGYSYFDEGIDSICYYLSLNRARAVKSYVLGKGLDSARIIETNAKSYFRSKQRVKEKIPVGFNCTAEVTLHYPIPPDPSLVEDKDEDGITDKADVCPDEYGYAAFDGCPNKAAIIVPFEPQQFALIAPTYQVLDSVVALLRLNPALAINIEGHAYKKEGVPTVCDRLAKDRAEIVKRYLLSRQVASARIESVKSMGRQRPLNAGRNPWERSRNSRVEIFLVEH